MPTRSMKGTTIIEVSLTCQSVTLTLAGLPPNFRLGFSSSGHLACLQPFVAL